MSFLSHLLWLSWLLIVSPVVTTLSLDVGKAVAAPPVFFVLGERYLVFVELWLSLLDLSVSDWALVALHLLCFLGLNTGVLVEVILKADVLDITEAFIVASVGSHLVCWAGLLKLSVVLDLLKLLDVVKLLSLLGKSLLLLLHFLVLGLLKGSLLLFGHFAQIALDSLYG